MAVTPFDTPYPKTPCCMQISRIWSTERELLPVEVLHCGNRNYRTFWLLSPWPWPDDLHIRNQPVIRGDIPHVQLYELATSWHSKVIVWHTYIHTDRQTRPILYTTPLRGWSIIWAIKSSRLFFISANTVTYLSHYITQLVTSDRTIGTSTASAIDTGTRKR